MPPAAMPVVYNGVERPRAQSAAEIRGLRGEWGVSDCARVIGSVGRLDWQKGYDLFLKSLDHLAPLVPSGERWGVVLLGEGPQRPALMELAAKAPACFAVRMPGFWRDAPSAAGAFDPFVMPSRYEGFGLTLAEAMGHGLPVVASAADSLPELLEGYGNGWTVDFSAPSAAAAAIAGHIGAGMGPADARFTVPAMVSAYQEIYRRLCLDAGE
jgi:glycosyltransferase involved in cell wall biosynthesis